MPCVDFKNKFYAILTYFPCIGQGITKVSDFFFEFRIE
jgi:hypothetical protein